MQVRLLRRLLEEAAKAVTGGSSAKLSTECESLVTLAEPGDAYSAFTASMNASAIASHIKAIESRFGLKASTSSRPLETPVRNSCCCLPHLDCIWKVVRTSWPV